MSFKCLIHPSNSVAIAGMGGRGRPQLGFPRLFFTDVANLAWPYARSYSLAGDSAADRFSQSEMDVAQCLARNSSIASLTS